MAFENTAVFSKVADDAADRYDLGSVCKAKLLQLSENATYLIYDVATGEKRGALRVSRPGYHTLSELNSEMNWLNQINEYTPLIVARPIKGTDGKEVQIVKGSDGKDYFCVLTEFLSGSAPDENDEKAAVKQYEYLGQTTAYLHRQTEIWNGTKKIDRISWTYDNIIGATPVWGKWEAASDLTSEIKTMLTKTSEIIKKRLERYGKNSNNYGLIHADLRLSNILIEGDQIKVIDFDDCGFGWHLHDMASALSFIETKPIVPKLVNAWLDGYRKVLPFTDTDFTEIDTFIMQRRMQLMAWIASHYDSDPVKKLSIGFTPGTAELAERYLRLFG